MSPAEDLRKIVDRTVIFRHENGVWKLVHRHGDSLVEKTKATAILQR
jgi:hypothetical protein